VPRRSYGTTTIPGCQPSFPGELSAVPNPKDTKRLHHSTGLDQPLPYRSWTATLPTSATPIPGHRTWSTIAVCLRAHSKV